MVKIFGQPAFTRPFFMLRPIGLALRAGTLSRRWERAPDLGSDAAPG